MADEFRRSVELGLRLSKRIYYGNEPSMKPPKQPPAIAKWPSPDVEDHLPKAPMVYAEISDPSIVDNPDIPSYQPYVYGRCKPPALIPLHMYGIEVKVECYLDMAFVTVSGSWRLHCVASGRSCDCRVAIPMGEQGSVLGFDIDASRGSYHTQLLTVEDAGDLDGLAKAEYGGLLKANLFTLKIPKVDGGSKLSVKASWSQKLLYQDDKFLLSVPFSFPVYVTPPGKLSKREKILLNINSGTGTEILCKTATHPLKELCHEVEKLGFLYESEVFTWSQADFEFSYTISSGDIHGGLVLQPPPPNDCDQREMFAFYLFPGDSHNRKVFRKKVVFLVDISGSMKGAPIENVKKAVLSSLSNLNQDDFFNIIAFNGEAHLFSSSMELASLETLQQAREWMSSKLIADGYTNILLPMNQDYVHCLAFRRRLIVRRHDIFSIKVDDKVFFHKALHMVSHGSNLISFIFLITDGAVENERDICNLVKVYCTKEIGLAFPRISTFGIGSYCNHYFLQMLAQIGRGHYDAAYDTDSIVPRLQRLYTMSSLVILSNIEFDWLNHVESLTLYPSTIQDLSYGGPVIMSGRYKGTLPKSLKVHGILADMTAFITDVTVHKAEDVPLDNVFAKRQIDILTSQAWFMRNKEVKKQVAGISMQTGVPSEYTRMILVQTDCGDQGMDSIIIRGKEAYDKTSLQKMVSSRQIFPLLSLGIGFGDLKNTAENLPPGVTTEEPHTTQLILRTASGWCSQLLDRICCMCFIQACSKLSDQCVITLSQLCAALSCFECLNCCYDLCVNCG